MNTRQFNMMVAGALAVFGLCACDDETTAVPDSPAMSVLESGKKMDACSKDNAGEMVYVSDSAAVFYCAEGEWQILNGKDGVDGKDGADGNNGKDGEKGEDGQSGLSTRDTLVVNHKDTIVVNQKDTVIVNLKDTVVVNQKDTVIVNRKDTVVVNHKDTVVVRDTVVVINRDTVFVGMYSSSVVEGVSSSSVVGGASSSSVVNGVSSSSVLVNPPVTYGSFVDGRNNYTYKTIRIGNQVWFAENLQLEVLEGACYGNVADNCAVYGVYYLSSNLDQVCPSGWSLPNRFDWDILVKNAEGVSNLKTTTGWNAGNGTDESGFSAFPAGRYIGSNYELFGDVAFFLGQGIYTYIQKDELVSTSLSGAGNIGAMPVRCMQNLPCDEFREGEYAGWYICQNGSWILLTAGEHATHKLCESGNDGEFLNGYVCDRLVWRESMSIENELGKSCTQVNEYEVDGEYLCRNSNWGNYIVDDRDGKLYRTTKIGNQVWMAENLNYADSTNYPEIKTRSVCYGKDSLNCAKYGRLYTWSVAMDSAARFSTHGQDCGSDLGCSPTYPVRGICPEGWHLPTIDEWGELITFVGGKSTNEMADALASKFGWSNLGKDTWAFSALSTGICDGGASYGEGSQTVFWSSTKEDDYHALGKKFVDRFTYVLVESGDFYKHNDYSIRCVKDSE